MTAAGDGCMVARVNPCECGDAGCKRTAQAIYARIRQHKSAHIHNRGQRFVYSEEHRSKGVCVPLSLSITQHHTNRERE
ncbi:MAG: hypothetical protein ACK56F_20850 [bacterium]